MNNPGCGFSFSRPSQNYRAMGSDFGGAVAVSDVLSLVEEFTRKKDNRIAMLGLPLVFFFYNCYTKIDLVESLGLVFLHVLFRLFESLDRSSM